jgi:predicted ATPase
MAKFIKTFSLLKEWHEIKPFKMTFKDGFNIVVGENGSGKSTLLHLMTDNETSGLKDFRKIEYEPGSNFRFLDTEKQNPRIQSSSQFSVNLRYEIGSHFISHGEAMLPLVLASKEFNDIVLIIDEPEAGISLQNQKKIFDTLQKICHENNCQVIMTTHSYVMIKNIDKVFDMCTKKWITSEKYLKTLKI